jgi:hypothetical protein
VPSLYLVTQRPKLGEQVEGLTALDTNPKRELPFFDGVGAVQDLVQSVVQSNHVVTGQLDRRELARGGENMHAR